MDDGVEIMENEQEEVLNLLIQPMALEAAREATERKDALKREQKRMEGEQENNEWGADHWVNYDGTAEDEGVI